MVLTVGNVTSTPEEAIERLEASRARLDKLAKHFYGIGLGIVSRELSEVSADLTYQREVLSKYTSS